jgi:dienelactone hydrolase
VKDAVAYLHTLSYVNQKRIGLVSHSMGALPFTKTMTLTPTIKTGVLMSPASDTIVMAADGEKMAKGLASMAVGKLSGATQETLSKDLIEVAKVTNPMELIQKIKAPIMVVVGSMDTVTPPDACKTLYDKAAEPKMWVVIEGADHGFSEHRDTPNQGGYR